MAPRPPRGAARRTAARRTAARRTAARRTAARKTGGGGEQEAAAGGMAFILPDVWLGSAVKSKRRW